jgi:hypothetical protein
MAAPGHRISMPGGSVIAYVVPRAYGSAQYPRKERRCLVAPPSARISYRTSLYTDDMVMFISLNCRGF